MVGFVPSTKQKFLSRSHNAVICVYDEGMRSILPFLLSTPQ